MYNNKPLRNNNSRRSSRLPRMPSKRLSLRRLPLALPPRWKDSPKSMTVPRLNRDVEAAEAVVAAEMAAVKTVSVVVAVAAEAVAVTSMVNAVAVVVEEAVAVEVTAVIADLEEKTVRVVTVVAAVAAKWTVAAAEAPAVTVEAVMKIVVIETAELAVVKVEEAVAVVVIVVIVVLAPREKVAVRVVAAEETGEILMSAMDISRVTDRMAPAVDVVETAKVATRKVAGVVTNNLAKRARSRVKRAREPKAHQKKKRRRRLLADVNPNLSKKRKKKLDSPLMTTWPRSRLTQRDSSVKRQA